MDLKTLIAYNIDFQLEKTGYSRTRDSNYRNFSRADEEILQAALKISSQLENDARFSGILASFQTFGVSKESFLYVLDQLLVGEINWARIMSVVTLSGTLAVQCMENNEEYKTDLIQDWASSFAEVKLKIWMDNNNGLEGFRQYFQKPEHHVNHWEKKLIAAGACGAVGMVVGIFVAIRA